MRTMATMVFALGMVLAGSAGAQTIRGRLVDSLTHAPVPSALAELRDLQGKLVTQTFTSPSGTFVLVGQANTKYQVRIAAIGFAKHTPINVTAGADPVLLPDIALTQVVITLPELHALAGKRACGSSQLNAETFGGLLESAHTSLQMMDATLRSAQLGFEIQTVDRIAVKTDKDSSISADTVTGTLRDWPVRSLSLDSLKALGFQRPKTPEEGSGRHYYGPDMQVLFSDWFLDGHCFTLDKDRSKGDTVVIKFDPAGKPKNVDISGEMILDRASLTMRRLTYVHRNIPDGVPDRSAGGEMRFAEKSEGLWLPVEWAVWAPITKANRQISRPMTTVIAPGQRGAPARTMSSGPVSAPPPLIQIVGRDEARGRLLRVVPLGGG
jgi:hypothetical protein